MTQTTQLLYLTLVLINVTAYIFMRLDKIKAKNGSSRIPEKTLIIWALCFGSVGVWLGMYFPSKHKTNHAKFFIFIPLILMLQIAGFIYYFGS